MTTPKLDDLINDPFLQALSGRDDSTPLTLNQVAGLLQIAPETLRKRHRQGQEPPAWMDLRHVFPGISSGPVWRLRLGTLRDLLSEIYAGAPPPRHAQNPTSTALPDKTLLDAASPAADSGWHEPPMRGRQRPRHATFATFLSTGTIPTADVHGEPDVWLFVLIGRHKRPVDFFHALDMEVSDDDTCEWMTLDSYITALRWAAIAELDVAKRAEKLAGIPAVDHPPLERPRS